MRSPTTSHHLIDRLSMVAASENPPEADLGMQRLVRLGHVRRDGGAWVLTDTGRAMLDRI